jgi:hypothetical protein
MSGPQLSVCFLASHLKKSRNDPSLNLSHLKISQLDVGAAAVCLFFSFAFFFKACKLVSSQNKPAGCMAWPIFVCFLASHLKKRPKDRLLNLSHLKISQLVA